MWYLFVAVLFYLIAISIAMTRKNFCQYDYGDIACITVITIICSSIWPLTILFGILYSFALLVRIYFGKDDV
jgi:hypothetical protein